MLFRYLCWWRWLSLSLLPLLWKLSCWWRIIVNRILFPNGHSRGDCIVKKSPYILSLLSVHENVTFGKSISSHIWIYISLRATSTCSHRTLVRLLSYWHFYTLLKKQWFNLSASSTQVYPVKIGRVLLYSPCLFGKKLLYVQDELVNNKQTHWLKQNFSETITPIDKSCVLLFNLLINPINYLII